MTGWCLGETVGAAADAVTHPIDTARVRLQIQTASGTAARYRGLLHTLVLTVRHEGWRALYKGFGAVLSATAPAHALYFAGYELVKHYLPRDTESRKHLTHFVAGFGADIGGSLVWVPMVLPELVFCPAAWSASSSLVLIWGGGGRVLVGYPL